LWQAQQQDAEGYFRNKLGTIDEPTTPFGLVDVYGDGSEIEEHGQAVEAALALRVRRAARRLGVSCATLFHAAWGLVVGSTSAREDVCLGVCCRGGCRGMREQTGTGDVHQHATDAPAVGVSVGELVQQTQREVVELLRYEQTPLSLAQRWCGLSAGVPLFSAVLNYRHSAQHRGAPQSEAESEASGIRVLVAQERTNYPLTVSVDDLGRVSHSRRKSIGGSMRSG